MMAPLCGIHFAHWRFRYAILGVSIWIILALFFTALYAFPANYRMVTVGVGVAALICWVAAAIFFENTAIRLQDSPVEGSLKLAGVAEEFVDELKQWRSKGHAISETGPFANSEVARGRLRLTREEVEGKQMPYVCIRCGEPASSWKKSAVSIPSQKEAWAGLVAGEAGMLFMRAFRQKLMLRVPFCSEHQDHWQQLRTWQKYLVAGIVVGGILIGSVIGAMVLRGRSLGGILVIMLLVLLITPLFAIFVNLRNNSVRVADITEDDICLDGVAAQFIVAVAEARGQTNQKRASSRAPQSRKPRSSSE
jgi:hypothetical protein